jgi:prolyl oligopeptidase
MDAFAKHAFVTLLVALLTALPVAVADAPLPVDKYLWLEDVEGTRALDWVRERNAESQKELEAQPQFESVRTRLLATYDSEDRIPGVVKMRDHYYNFWRDKAHVRGIWRRTTLAEYRKSAPAWDTVLDLDALAASETENWVWSGFDCVAPTYDRCLIRLSRGGGDTFVQREFDIAKRDFVRDGFNLPAAKSEVSWRDRDHVFVATDFGAGSMTDSSYPRIVKAWQRGTSLDKATTVYEGQRSDVGAGAAVFIEHDYHRELIVRDIDFFNAEQFLYEGGKLLALDVPQDARVQSFQDQILITLRSDWNVGGRRHPSGAVLATDWKSFLAGQRNFQYLFTPSARVSLASLITTRNYLVVNELDNIRNKLYVLELATGKWQRRPLGTPELGNVSLRPVDDLESDDYFLTTAGFLTPSALYLGAIGSEKRELLKQLPAFFDTTGLVVSQHEATSADGTRIPYFQVAKDNLALDGSNPALLTAYGGFQISSLPNYSAGVGIGWLEKGGVYVLANLRGGGEFGPTWHQTAIKEHRQRAFDDFAAVASDLIKRKVTSPQHLGIMGGSNGGLLTGVALTQHPELYGAVVCQVPLLDMRRYSKLSAGASWIAEYGDPDKPDEWDYISRYSPYQNVRADRHYPRVLFTTSTRDDRVHPGHARKMTARMLEQGHDVLLYENTEGGHGGAANNQQQAYMGALAYTFLWKQLR